MCCKGDSILKIIIGKEIGMCKEIKNAISEVEYMLQDHKYLYSLGEFVHNRQVQDKLEAKGLMKINYIDEVPPASNIIISTYGAEKKDIEYAISKGMNIYDLTCPHIRTIQEKVEKESKRSFIIIIGNEKHPEVKSIKSFAGKNSIVVDELDEIDDAWDEFQKSGLDFVYVVSQSAFPTKKFEQLSDIIREQFKKRNNFVMIDKTIFLATDDRQKETMQITKVVHSMVIIGGKNSYNTLKLVETAKQYSEKVYFIETKKDLRKTNFKNVPSVGIMSGISTPDEVIADVIELFINWGGEVK